MPRDPEEDRCRRRRSTITMDDVSEDFSDRCSSSSSSSRRRSHTSQKTDKTTTKKSETIYTARHAISRKRTYDEVCSLSTTSTTEFDRFEKSWEEIDYDRERAAARVAVDGIRDTAGFEMNRDAVKVLESMCECSYYYVLGGNPLMRLGLFLKPEYSNINDEDEEATLFGDIHCTKKPYIHMGRSMQHKVEKEKYGTENYSSGLLLNGTTVEATRSCGYATSSPRKGHDRVEMLKLRFKDTILKAQKALGLSADYDKQQGNCLKTTEVCSRSSRSTTTTIYEFDEFEKLMEETDRDHLRRRRERDREAARVAVDGIRDTAHLENNRDAVRELESMCECSSYYVLGYNPLNSIGLFLKPEYSDINDEDEEAILFGDIHRTKKRYTDMGRSMQHKVGTIEETPSCGHATSSPRKAYDRVEMLKLRYMNTIRKAQKTHDLSAEYNKQQGIGLKTTTRTRQHCRSKATINAPIRGATLA